MIGDPEDLTNEQRTELHERLVALEAQLQDALDSSQKSAAPVELDQSTMGRVSRIDAIQQQQMARASLQAARTRLAQVRAALQAVAEDTYGECRRCEEPIGYARLAARPETPFCLDCQTKRESRL